MGHEGLRIVLVHARRRSEDAGADVGRVAEFEQALQGSVFPVLAVQERKEDVDGSELGVLALGVPLQQR